MRPLLIACHHVCSRSAGMTGRKWRQTVNQMSVIRKPIVATAEVNGSELYRETRGNGPPILFIAGATGDGGMFQRVAERLADEFTIVTYHPRGNSLSPIPDGWTSTTFDEQADHAAALLRAVDPGPAVVFGNSLGAGILLNHMLRHTVTLRGAIVHEPVLAHVVPGGAAYGAEVQEFVETGLATVGARRTMEWFIRTVAGDENFEHLDPELREPMLGNAEVFLFTECPAGMSFTPDAGELAACRLPERTAVGIETLAPILRESAAWSSAQFGVPLQEYPGAHTPYLDYPGELAGAIRTFAHALA